MKLKSEVRGELLAKKEALKTVETTKAVGFGLLLLLLATSALHLFAVLSGVHLPAILHTAGAVLQVLAIDASALYLLSARGALLEAGLDGGKWATRWLVGLTASLNAVYLLSSFAGLPVWAVSLAPIASAASVIGLVGFFPVAVTAVEGARHKLGTARLSLLGTIEELETSLREDETQQTSSGSASPVPSLSVSVDARTLVVTDPAKEREFSTEREFHSSSPLQAEENYTTLAGLLETGTAETLELSRSVELSPVQELVPVGETSPSSGNRRSRIAELLTEGNRTKGKIYAEVGGNKSRTYALIGEVAEELGISL